MPIQRLVITDVRNIRGAELERLGPINVLFGKNGSGKTSILEAIHLLGLGKSFRSTKLKPIINHEAQTCAVYGLVLPDDGKASVGVGVARTRDGQSINKVQGAIVKNAASLAEQLPLQILNSDSFAILSGGPRQRRRFLDGGVFHVEHRFHQAWLQVQRCLKQRNSLLRRAKIDPRLLEPWTAELAASSEHLNVLRKTYFEEFRPVFLELMDELFELEGLNIDFYSGWDRQRKFSDVLEEGLASDMKQGYTHSGPHRADMRVKINGLNVADVLSRGQQKLVVAALKLAQARLLVDKTEKTSVFLVDDLPAELDREFRESICAVLEQDRGQAFITCVDSKDLAGCWINESQINMFHVEHGSVSYVSQ